jgi:hypothetical protein
MFGCVNVGNDGLKFDLVFEIGIADDLFFVCQSVNGGGFAKT